MTNWNEVVNSDEFLCDEDIQRNVFEMLNEIQQADVATIYKCFATWGFTKGDIIKLVWNGDAYDTGYNNFKDLAKHLIHTKGYEHYTEVEDLALDLESSDDYIQDENANNEIIYIHE